MKKTLSLLIISGLLMPLFSFAETETRQAAPIASMKMRQEKREDMKENLHEKASSTKGTATSTRELGFCQNIDKVLLSIGTKVTKTEDKRAAMASSTDEKRTTTRTKRDEKRDENTTNKKSQLAELNKRATTDAQKQAVATFVTAMEQALKTKNAAIDQILLTHRAEVDKATSARRMETEQALAIRKADIEVAKNKAKTDCSGGVAGETVRTTLRASIERAQMTFVTTIKNIEKVKDVTLETRSAKKEELKKIEATYLATMKKAKEDLKLAFKATASASSTGQ